MGFLNTTKIECTRGEIWVRSLGILVGRLDRPVLTKPSGDDTPQVGQYVLQTAFSYLNAALWEDKEFAKQIKLYLGKRPFRAIPIEGAKVTLDQQNKTLRIEGVNTEWLTETE